MGFPTLFEEGGFFKHFGRLGRLHDIEGGFFGLLGGLKEPIQAFGLWVKKKTQLGTRGFGWFWSIFPFTNKVFKVPLFDPPGIIGFVLTPRKSSRKTEEENAAADT